MKQPSVPILFWTKNCVVHLFSFRWFIRFNAWLLPPSWCQPYDNSQTVWPQQSRKDLWKLTNWKRRRKRRSGCGSFRQPLYSSIIVFFVHRLYLFTLRSFSPCRRIIGSKPTVMAMKCRWGVDDSRCRSLVKNISPSWRSARWEWWVETHAPPFLLGGPWFVMWWGWLCWGWGVN